jgi:hypothetical protein
LSARWWRARRWRPRGGSCGRAHGNPSAREMKREIRPPPAAAAPPRLPPVCPMDTWRGSAGARRHEMGVNANGGIGARAQGIGDGGCDVRSTRERKGRAAEAMDETRCWARWQARRWRARPGQSDDASAVFLRTTLGLFDVRCFFYVRAIF